MSRNEIWDRYPHICHYTKYEKIQSILDSKVIWAQHYSKLDDPTEIEHARDMMIYHLRKYHNELPVRAILDTYKKYLTDVYITSFTKPDIKICLRENDGILSMWRFYGPYKLPKEGGCSIEFKSKKLHDKYLTFVQGNLPISSAIVFDEVQYDGIKESKKNIRKMLQYYSRCLKILITMYRNKIPQEKEQANYVNAFISCISLFKHQAFFEERELRIVVFTNPRFGVLDNNEIPVSHQMFKRLEIPFELNDISKIIIGPQEDQENKLNELKEYLQSKSINISVFGSKIPFKMVAKE